MASPDRASAPPWDRGSFDPSEAIGEDDTAVAGPSERRRIGFPLPSPPENDDDDYGTVFVVQSPSTPSLTLSHCHLFCPMRYMIQGFVHQKLPFYWVTRQDVAQEMESN